MKKYRSFLIAIIMISLNNCASAGDLTKIHIRTNQIGYDVHSAKTAIILSNTSLENERFEVISNKTNNRVYDDLIGKSKGEYAQFKYSYELDFSDITQNDSYRLRLNGNYSYNFRIGKSLFTGIPKNLLKFFPVQRCGYTSPELHEPCHRSDATSLINGNDTIKIVHDLTGGWHDAGDYIKFLNTTAYATYTLLFAYEINKSYFEFDNDKNGTPDILEEAKIGLDWLLRCSYNGNQLISQVQDLRDHDVGWRLPENDTLQYDRPAIIGMGKNTIGIYTAALALASQIWKSRFSSFEFADECLTVAENIFSRRNVAPDIDSTSSAYLDNSYKGKLALGAVELFRATNNEEFKTIAIDIAEEAEPNYWWSYSEIDDFAFYRLAEYENRFLDKIETTLQHFEDYSEKNLFNAGVEFFWGSNHTMLGIVIKEQLINKLKGKKELTKLSISQIDYILGKNPWGISFINKIGRKFSKNFHHQVSHLLKMDLPGGFAAGPVKREILDSYKIEFDSVDRFSVFQTEQAVYRDDRMDYITNEPTIIANALGILVFSLL